MYEEFYGLKEKPFNLTPDPRFFFLSENHREAFDHLLYGIKEKEGFILITGEVGTGKTLLCRALLNKIDSSSTDTALILNPALSEQELLQSVLSDFGIDARGRSKKEMLDNLNRFLIRQHSPNRQSVLIIDEAQNLTLPALEEIRMLSNFETEKEKLLQIIFLGQMELKQKLSLAQLRQLNQRISVRYHIKSLKKEEVPRYIQHRLMVAGSAGDINFTSGALREIYRYSQGIPRLINLAADRALLAGYAEQSREIGRGAVIKGLKSLGGEEIPLPRHRVWRRRLASGFAGLLILCSVLLAAMIFAGSHTELFETILNYGGFSASAPSAKETGQPDQDGGGALYSVHLGAYGTEAEAREAARKVDASGYPLFLSKAESSEGVESYRLYLGKFAQKAEAQGVAEAIEKTGDFSATQVVLISGRAAE